MAVRKKVCKNKNHFKSFNIPSGVAEGFVLCPIFLSLFINDIPFYAQNSHRSLYANDTLLGMDISECVSVLYELSSR